jgi:hypothetical protein
LDLTSTGSDRNSLLSAALLLHGNVVRFSSLLLLLDRIRALRDELEGSLASRFHTCPSPEVPMALSTADEEYDDTDNVDDDDDDEGDDDKCAALITRGCNHTETSPSSAAQPPLNAECCRAELSGCRQSYGSHSREDSASW